MSDLEFEFNHRKSLASAFRMREKAWTANVNVDFGRLSCRKRNIIPSYHHNRIHTRAICFVNLSAGQLKWGIHSIIIAELHADSDCLMLIAHHINAFVCTIDAPWAVTICISNARNLMFLFGRPLLLSLVVPKHSLIWFHLVVRSRGDMEFSKLFRIIKCVMPYTNAVCCGVFRVYVSRSPQTQSNLYGRVN